MHWIGHTCEDSRCRTGRLPVCPGHLAIAALLIWLGVRALMNEFRAESIKPEQAAEQPLLRDGD
jgi:hypothetical protein